MFVVFRYGHGFWCRWAWNWTVNELDSTCCHHKTSKYTSNLFLTNNWSLLWVLYIWYIVKKLSHKSIIWLLKSLWCHFKWDWCQTWTKPWLGIQDDVCKVLFPYLFLLWQYHRRSKCGQIYAPPPVASEWQRPSGSQVNGQSPVHTGKVQHSNLSMSIKAKQIPEKMPGRILIVIASDSWHCRNSHSARAQKRYRGRSSGSTKKSNALFFQTQ